MNKVKENDYYIGSHTKRATKEDCLIESGLRRADKIYENIMNEYATSGWYNDDTDVIGCSQFLSLFYYFAGCLYVRGWTQEDLNKEISNVIARDEEESREEKSL